MKKTFTKEQLAARLDGWENRDAFPIELLQLAETTRLVVIAGGSDDLVLFSGAIDEEVCAYDGGVIPLARNGVPESDCVAGDDCSYFKKWLNDALKNGEVKEIKAFWEGECKRETMDPAKYAALGKPTWCFETTIPHAVFSMYDTGNGDREFFCRCLVIDLDEAFPFLSYEQRVM